MYPSKILLFGEYTILLNSSAIAVPYQRFSGDWDFVDPGSDEYYREAYHSNQVLKGFMTYLGQLEEKQLIEYPLDIEKFDKDLENRLYFKSNIPKGCGLGSSGAITAATFNRYAKNKNEPADIIELRKILALLESYFHGTSSGIDPLVSYLNIPVLIKSNNIVESLVFPVEKVLTSYGLFLVDSQQEGKTSRLVNHFNNRCGSDPGYLKKLQDQYIPLNNECIEALTCLDNSKSFFSVIKNLTRLQLVLFNEMIPGKLIPLIEYGLENELFYLKLCGSGGGGYFIGFTEYKSETQIFLKEKGYEFMILDDDAI